MFKRETTCSSHPPTNTLSTLSIISSHRTFSEVGGAYSTSLSSRAIGSALVDRLKLQSRVAPRGKRGRRRGRIKIRREGGEIAASLDRLLWSTLIRSDRFWNLRGWYGDDSRQERRVLICPARFQFLPADLKEDAARVPNERSFRTVDLAALARLKLPAWFLPPGSMERCKRLYIMDD